MHAQLGGYDEELSGYGYEDMELGVRLARAGVQRDRLSALVPEWSRPVYHLYVVRVGERERVQQQLADAGIGTGIHYPIPLHLSKAYESLFLRPGDFPVAEQAATEILSLPMFPGLSLDSQQRVVAELVKAVKETAAAASEPERVA